MSTLSRPVIKRRALFDVLSEGITRGIILLSASPGSGKTTLLKSWLDSLQGGTRCAWVSVERGERDAQHFWLTVQDRLHDAAEGEAPVEPVLPAPDFDAKAFVDRLIQSLTLLQQPIVLVIDDLHELRSAEALAQLEGLLSGRPPLLRVILSTRHDVQLGLHRLRLSGELTEVRDSDLRFTFEQTREVLSAAGILLPDESIAVLHSRTEGWAAGVQLAAISLATTRDPANFIAGFSGSERTIAEYLLAEVLQHEPDDVREFLLRTSILEQVNGELADALLGRSGSERILQALEESNAFVTAIDASRSWFRYHHLFADLLRLELRRNYPDAIVPLHRAAALWYEGQGRVVDAVKHAQKARDWTYASQLLAEHYFSLWLNGQDATVEALLGDFPSGAGSDPDVALLFALTQLNRGSLEEAEVYIALAEREAYSIPETTQRRFRTALAVARLTLARLRGNFSSVLDEVQPLLSSANNAQTVDEIALSNDLRALALMNLGIAEKWSTRFDEGEQHLLQGLQLARRIGRPYVQIGCLSYLGLHFKKWTTAVGKARCEEAIAIAESQGWASEPIVATATVRIAGYAVREGRLDDAELLLQSAQRALRAEADPAVGLLFSVARGGYYLGRGRFEDALACFEAAHRLRSMLAVHHAFSAIAFQHLVMTQVRMANISAARTTLANIPEDRRKSAEYCVGLASVELADGNARAAADLLLPLLNGSVPIVNIFTTAAALLLDAHAQHLLGERQSAHDDLERVLELAENEALIPAFAIAATPLRKLLEQHLQHTAHRPLLTHILDVLAGAATPSRADEDRFAEELSESELRVLRYLPTNLRAPEIAAELNLSLNTVKTHIREIYGKLGAHSRSEAVERARKLGLTRFG